MNLLFLISSISSQIESPSHLRYCPNCVVEDRERYKRTYWHRIHQLSGISACPLHQCFLENSSIELGRISSSYFHDAEIFLPAKLPNTVKLDLRKKSHKILHKIACDAKWLLSNSSLKIGSKIVQNRYFNILLKQGYTYYNGRLKHKRFLQASREFFPPEIFKMVGRISDRENWLMVLTQAGNVNITYHPTRHLLLQTFLGLSAKEFFEDFEEYKPFGDPPYPCLNLAANHYKELVIEECKILDNISKDVRRQGIPIGIFRCDCGFTYQRLGADKSDEHKFFYNSVKEYGAIWETQFSEMWADLALSTGQIGKSLGINQTSVGRQAIRLNLPMNTETTRPLHGYERHRNPNKSFSQVLNLYRADWIEVRRKYPNLTRKQLLNKANFLYLWLRRNDFEWFKDQIPSQATKRVKRERLNWKEIDKKLSEKVEMLCEKLLSSKDFPVRISITEITKRSGQKVWIDKRNRKLPKTAIVVDKYLETLEDFMIRKIEWTSEKYIAENEVPSINKFKSRATLRNRTSDDSERIQKTIKDSLIKIKNSVNFS